METTVWVFVTNTVVYYVQIEWDKCVGDQFSFYEKTATRRSGKLVSEGTQLLCVAPC